MFYLHLLSGWFMPKPGLEISSLALVSRCFALTHVASKAPQRKHERFWIFAFARGPSLNNGQTSGFCSDKIKTNHRLLVYFQEGLMKFILILNFLDQTQNIHFYIKRFFGYFLSVNFGSSFCYVDFFFHALCRESCLLKPS